MHHLLMWYISERCNAPKVYTYREEIRDEILENMMNNKIIFVDWSEYLVNYQQPQVILIVSSLYLYLCYMYDLSDFDDLV